MPEDGAFNAYEVDIGVEEDLDFSDRLRKVCSTGSSTPLASFVN